MVAFKAVELIVSGDLDGVCYRFFVTEVARKLKLVGFAENLEDGTVRIRCKGEVAAVEMFKELINVKNPSQAPVSEVENIAETPIDAVKITDTCFKAKFGDIYEEMTSGFAERTRVYIKACSSIK